MAYGAGWAAYRSRDGRHGRLRMWAAAKGAWTADWSIEPSRRAGMEGFWEGVAAAYEWDLGVLMPRWILEGLEPGGWLTAELAALAANLPPQAGPRFCLAAGRVAGRALHDPSVIRSRRARTPRQPEELARAIPGTYQEIFLRGVREGLALF